MTAKRPHRCPDCGWRGWGEETGQKFSDAAIELAELALARDAPDLKGSNLPSSDPRHQIDIDLGSLDVLAPVNKGRQ
jgi:hypothetical protein